MADFGFAKRLAPGVKTFTLCGTPEYLAPELVTQTGHARPVDWLAFSPLPPPVSPVPHPFCPLQLFCPLCPPPVWCPLGCPSGCPSGFPFSCPTGCPSGFPFSCPTGCPSGFPLCCSSSCLLFYSLYCQPHTCTPWHEHTWTLSLTKQLCLCSSAIHSYAKTVC